MISFDVVSLFTKVPIDDILSYLEIELKRHNFEYESNIILSLIKLCIKGCKFTFNENFYLQCFGMSMGNPLSPVMANLYMEFFESRLLPSILPERIFWKRYVDDVFCLWPNSENVDSFLENLNSLVPSVKFTKEEENDHRLAFLDVLVHRHEGRFLFKVYRKPTNILPYIHYYSSHNIKVKRSVFNSMFLRALRVVSPQYFDEEIENIYSIGLKLCYPRSILDRALETARKTFFRTSNVNLNFNSDLVNSNFNENADQLYVFKKFFMILPYFVNFEFLVGLLNHFNVKLIFKYNNSVKHLLIKNSPVFNKGYVYAIPCNDCNKVYVGQNGKEIKIKIKQHQYAVKVANSSNACFQHLNNFDHQLNWNNVKSLFKSSNYISRSILESTCIKYLNNFNLCEGNYSLDSLLFNLLLKDKKIEKELKKCI